MSKLRVLYVANEVNPFLKITKVAELVRNLPEAMQNKGMEIRILVPRFGMINERRNRLHEVVRLSGINIAVGEEEKPLVIKVASIPKAKLQVYFIDNDDYFHRKSVFTDKEENYHEDNDERAIFFCKGVLETVKKLGWAPDIVHCNDWMTGLIPLYLNEHYKKDPIYQNTKTVYSVYDPSLTQNFGNVAEKVKCNGMDDHAVSGFQSADYSSFIKAGVNNADVVVNSMENSGDNLDNIFDLRDDKSIVNLSHDDDYDQFYELYQDLVNVDELVS